METSTSTHRLHYLDSARGLAALSVTTLHFLLAVYGLNTTDAHFTTPFKLFWNGEPAVLFFFIHSGFILSYTFHRRGGPLNAVNYGKYLVERIFRIYPLFLLILLISYAAANNTTAYHPVQTDDYVSRFWTQTFSFRDLLQQALLVVRIPESANARLIPQDWTLTVELIAGAMIPLLAAAGKKHFAGFLLLLALLKISGVFSTWVLEFGLGVALFLFREPIQRYWKKMGLALKLLLLLGGLLAYSGCFVFPAVFAGQPRLIDPRVDRLIALTGCVLFFIILLGSVTAQRWLNQPLLVLMGKICYSSYLVHQLLLFIGWRLWGDTLGQLYQSPIALVAAVYLLFLLLVLAASYAGYRLVEKPMIGWGKKLLRAAISHH